MEENVLKKDFEYYLKNQDKLVEEFNGTVLIIKNCQVIGNYDTEIEALKAMKGLHELGTYLIQKCSPGDKDYTMKFHSRVYFEDGD